MDNCPILDKLIDRGHAIESSETALLVATFLGLIVNDRPVVQEPRANAALKSERGPL